MATTVATMVDRLARRALDDAIASLHRNRGLAMLLLAGLLPTSCARRPTGPPNVVVVVVDTLRADRLGCYGNPRGLTPFLDGLAARGAVFRNAYATTSWTNPSVASLFTSRYPSQHQVTTFFARLSPEEVNVVAKLDPLGYLGGGFSANFGVADQVGRALGFRSCHAYHTNKPKLRAAPVIEAGLAWVDRVRRRAPRRPLFLYFQFMEPHFPYDPPPEYRRRFDPPGRRGDDALAINKKLLVETKAITEDDLALLRSLYDGEVALMDAELRRLFGELEKRRVLEHALVVVTADHGEEFKEHGGIVHGDSLYNEVLRVPLIVLAPGQPAGRTVAQNVSLVDVAPTLLDLLHLPPEPRFEGRSLLPLWQGDVPPVDVVAELPTTAFGAAPRHTLALVRGSIKLLVRPDSSDPSGDTETYDLARDPAESAPRPSPPDADAHLLLEALHRHETALAERAPTHAEHRPPSETTRERLRALGYVN